MAYTTESVQRMLAALDELNIAADALETVDAPTEPGGRIAYLGTSDLGKCKGTTPTCRRSYYGLAEGGYNPDGARQKCEQDAAAGRMSMISIGPGNNANRTDPNIDHLEAFYPALRCNPDLIFIPWHEPEDDGVDKEVYAEFCATLINGVRANVPSARTAFCFMAYSFRSGGPGPKWLEKLDMALFDYAGWDSYNNAPTGTPNEPGKYHNEILAVAQDLGKPLIIPETGQDNRQGNPAVFWDNTVLWTQEHPEVYAHAWWPQVGPNGDHTPTSASLDAFQRALEAEPFNSVQASPC